MSIGIKARPTVPAVLAVLMAAYFSLAYISVRPLYPLDLYAAGQADVPFRIFPILAMHAMGHVPGFNRVAAHIPLEPHSPNLLAVAVLAMVGMLAAIWCNARTLRALGVSSLFADWFSLLMVVLSIFNLTPTWGLNYTVPYDVPALAFFCCGVWLVVTGRTNWLYVLFAFATLNRETSCFLVPFFVVWREVRGRGNASYSRRATVLHALGLCVVWYVVKVLPAHMYHGHLFALSSGDSMLVRAKINLIEICKPQQWPVLAGICAFTLPIAYLGRRWVRNEAFAAATKVVLAIWFLAILLQSVILEIRVFSEWSALVLPWLGLMAFHWTRAGAPVGVEASRS